MVMPTRAMYVTVRQLALVSVADVQDLTGKVQVFAGHRVIEVHFYHLVGDFHHLGTHHVAILVLQGKHTTHNHFAFKEISFLIHKDLFGQVLNGFRIVLTVTLFGAQAESESIVGFQTHDIFLEIGQELTGTEQESQRMAVGRLVQNFAVFVVVLKFIKKGDNLIFNCDHKK